MKPSLYDFGSFPDGSPATCQPWISFKIIVFPKEKQCFQKSAERRSRVRPSRLRGAPRNLTMPQDNPKSLPKMARRPLKILPCFAQDPPKTAPGSLKIRQHHPRARCSFLWRWRGRCSCALRTMASTIFSPRGIDEDDFPALYRRWRALFSRPLALARTFLLPVGVVEHVAAARWR